MRKTFSLEQVRRWTADIPTPFYIYDESGIRETVRGLYRAFSWNRGFREYFAVKALPTPAILRILAEQDCGFDCASIPEILLAEASCPEGGRIIFTSNETRPEEYRRALQAGAIINLDDITQIPILEEAAGIPETVCCRYNPGSFRGTNAIIGHLRDSKFGMTREQLFEAFRLLREKGARNFGLHAMLESCSLDESYYPALARELFTLTVEIREKLGIELSFLDFSGGIGIPYRPDEKAVNIQKVGEAVHALYMDILESRGMRPAIFTEMGRYITGPHGYLLARVVGEKHIYKDYVGVDASAADLMRPAMYGAYHEITVPGKESLPVRNAVDVVGPLCENNDKFAVDRLLPPLEQGDVLVIHDAGAHGHSMGYNYNGRLRCAEYLLRPDGSLRLIRRAETPADLFATLDVDEDFRFLY